MQLPSSQQDAQADYSIVSMIGCLCPAVQQHHEIAALRDRQAVTFAC